MRINSNTAAQKAVLGAGNAHKGLTDSLARISSGKRINQAADDASGMSIASSLRSRALAMGQGMKNASDGISVTQIADGALGEMTDILQSVRNRVMAAANGSQSQDSLNAIQSDINGSLTALNDIAGSTRFNGQTLLDGSFSNKQFAVGEEGQITISIPAVDAGSLGSAETGSLAAIDVTTPEGAQAALETVDQALEQINQARSGVGSTQNQFSSSINNLATSRVNLMAAESQITDVDLAEESMVLNQMEVLEKANLFALAQTNQLKKNSLVNLLG